MFVLQHIFCLCKKPQYLFFEMACLQVSSVLINCTLWSSYLFFCIQLFPTFSMVPSFSESMFFMVQVFQGPGFSGSRFFRIHMFRVQVFLGPGPGPRSRIWVQVLEAAMKNICKGKDTLWNFSYRTFHEIQFQGYFMKHEILSWNTFTLVSNIHYVCFSSIKNCVCREKISCRKFKNTKTYLNETMFEDQEQQKYTC